MMKTTDSYRIDCAVCKAVSLVGEQLFYCLCLSLINFFMYQLTSRLLQAFGYLQCRNEKGFLKQMKKFMLIHATSVSFGASE